MAGATRPAGPGGALVWGQGIGRSSSTLAPKDAGCGADDIVVSHAYMLIDVQAWRKDKREKARQGLGATSADLSATAPVAKLPASDITYLRQVDGATA
jgi:hypothetical protein